MMITPEAQAMLDEEFNGIYVQARREAVRAAVRRKIAADVANETSTDPFIRDAVSRLGKESFGKPKKEPGHWFITISGQEGIDPQQFWGQVEKLVKKKEFEGSSGEYSIEQRSEDAQVPYGWHIHMRAQLGKHVCKSSLVKSVYQCFSHYVAAANYVDVREVYNQGGLEAYMAGCKADPKMGKVLRDQKLRLDLGIPPKKSW